MQLTTAAKNLFDRFTQQGTLGKGAVRTEIEGWDSTEANLSMTQALLTIESFDQQPADQDKRPDHIRVPTSVMAEAFVAKEREDLEMYEGLTPAEQLKEARAELDARAAEAKNVKGETIVTIERNQAAMESITTIETTGDEADVEILYSSLPGKAFVKVAPEGDGFYAEAIFLGIGDGSFREELQGDWKLAK